MNVFDKINSILEVTTASEKRIRILKLGIKGKTELFKRGAERRKEEERRDALKRATARRAKAHKKELEAHDVLDLNP